MLILKIGGEVYGWTQIGVVGLCLRIMGKILIFIYLVQKCSFLLSYWADLGYTKDYPGVYFIQIKT